MESVPCGFPKNFEISFGLVCSGKVKSTGLCPSPPAALASGAIGSKHELGHSPRAAQRPGGHENPSRLLNLISSSGDEPCASLALLMRDCGFAPTLAPNKGLTAKTTLPPTPSLLQHPHSVAALTAMPCACSCLCKLLYLQHPCCLPAHRSPSVCFLCHQSPSFTSTW